MARRMGHSADEGTRRKTDSARLFPCPVITDMPPTSDQSFAAQHRLRLAYLVIEARRPDRWAEFCSRLLGLPAPQENLDGSQGWRIDAAAQRLVIAPGPADDLAALGFECADEQALDELLARLRGRGLEVADGAPALRVARRVRRLHCLRDPQGNAIELSCGMAEAPTPFVSPHFRAGFRAGSLGLGHAVLIARDLEAMERFYVDTLRLGVSERLEARVGPLRVRASFLHCNTRHHSLALMRLPLRKRLHHVMVEANDWRDVAAAWDRAQQLGVPMSMGLGQHPEPDGTVSFYGRSPSGFDFEIGAGSGFIDPERWQITRSSVTSLWGHRPSWRTRLRALGALLRLGS